MNTGVAYAGVRDPHLWLWVRKKARYVLTGRTLLDSACELSKHHLMQGLDLNCSEKLDITS